MSACHSLAIDYRSPSLPEPIMIAKSEDGKLVQSLLRLREEKAALLSHLGQLLLDNPSLAGLMGYTASYINDRAPVKSVEEAISRLDHEYWATLMRDAQFTMLMPAARREAFLSAAKNADRPPFTEEHVLPTIQGWLLDQDRFFAERVDGLFHSLSDTHITNSPAGFGGKMIIKTTKSGYGAKLDDLRLVLSCLLGKVTRLEAATMSYGSEWALDTMISQERFNHPFRLDEGALTIRVFKVGTCHVTIDPELAAHLNDILSMLYPLSIPAKFRAKNPIKPARAVANTNILIPSRILSHIFRMFKDKTFSYEYHAPMHQELAKVMGHPRKTYSACTIPTELKNEPFWAVLADALGATLHTWSTTQERAMVFSYSPRELIGELSLQGEIPDKKAFQFYPSKGRISRDFAARVEAHHAPKLTYLEPSAGTADLLDAMGFLDRRYLKTVELSTLSAAVLRAKRYPVIQADFLSQAAIWFSTQVRFDRITMNPPFCQSQAKDHTMAAYHLLNENGKLFAILPGSLYNAFDHLDAKVVKSALYENAFNDTQVTTFILELHKHGA